MAKKSKQLKRIVTKKGQIQYYKGGKRVSDAEALKILSTKAKARQKKAKESAKNLLYYKGKALSKAESYLLRLSLKDKVKNERRLDKLTLNDGSKLFKTKSVLDRLIIQQAKSMKNFFATENVRGKFKDGYEGKVDKRGSMDVARYLEEGAFSRFQVVLITADFQRLKGKVSVVNYLTKLEIYLMEIINDADPEKGVQVQFEYRIEVSTTLKLIMIDLSPIANNLEEFVRNSVKSGQNIIKFFKDLIIRIGYS